MVECFVLLMWPAQFLQRKIVLVHETLMAETKTKLRHQPAKTKTSTVFVKWRPRRDTGTSRDHLEAETITLSPESEVVTVNHKPNS